MVRQDLLLKTRLSSLVAGSLTSDLEQIEATSGAHSSSFLRAVSFTLFLMACNHMLALGSLEREITEILNSLFKDSPCDMQSGIRILNVCHFPAELENLFFCGIDVLSKLTGQMFAHRRGILVREHVIAGRILIDITARVH